MPKPLDGLLRDHPSQHKADDLGHQKADRVDPGIEREFNNVFMTLSKERKQALIKRWMDRKQCDREEAMRLAIEELRRDNSGFCETIGCYDATNHSKALKDNGGEFTGGKSKGYSLTNVGTKRGAALVKEIAGAAK